ncbi:HD-GYP domain-containing protein [Bacteriovorax sp. DB6_IX]|uniref:HD-GYP domain-containing protein n=1 Tax=Bacteriovorax sp. DB6_IX TaxID=1353530 RepID=UPI00038A1D6D|nr:HD domain-containing phosphohydrolase [Bacteriovorax sp. DB6_IX]EQC44415.1 HDIG domain protein [Bacteriovorax sp. DB6_IX]
MSKKTKKHESAEVISLSEVVTNVALLNLTKENNELKLEQKKICEMAARTILHALDCKDHYTYGHSMRVAYFSLSLGREIGLDEEELYDLELAALFHDIGKIGVPDSVLLKPSRLTEDEFLAMKAHPSKSAEILEGFTHFDKVAKYAKHHHERWDRKRIPRRS